MSEDETYGEFCLAMREARKEQRAHQYDTHHAQIKQMGIPCDVRNGGHHLIMKLQSPQSTGLDYVDFWPASGKWYIRIQRRYGMGLHRLLKIYPRPDAKKA